MTGTGRDSNAADHPRSSFTTACSLQHCQQHLNANNLVDGRRRIDRCKTDIGQIIAGLIQGIAENGGLGLHSCNNADEKGHGNLQQAVAIQSAASEARQVRMMPVPKIRMPPPLVKVERKLYPARVPMPARKSTMPI